MLAEVGQWQLRPLEAMYPIVYFDALRLKIRDEGTVRNKAVYLALGIRADGRKEVLGLWIEQTEGAKFWLKVFNELRNRGLADILIAVVDGLRGFPEAIEAVYPQAQIQTCIVHLIRNSLNLASWKDRKALTAALKPIYQAATAEAAAVRLMPLLKANGAANSRRWRPCGSGNGNRSSRSLPIRQRCAKLSTRPMPSRACTCSCARSSRIAATSRVMSSQQTAVSGLAQHRERLEDAAYHLEAGRQPVRHPVRRTFHQRLELI